MTRRLWLPAALLALALLSLAGWLRPRPPAPVRYREVVVHDTVLLRGRPDTVIRWRERIVWRTAPAEQVATAPGAAVADVAAFCGAAGYALPSAAPEGLAPGAPQGPPIPRRLLLQAGSFDGRELRQWGVRTDGDAWTASYRVRAPVRWTVAGDSLLVQADRWAALRRWGERALWMGIGAGIGYAADHID